MKIASLFLLFGITLTALASRVDVDVSGMTCGYCVESITKELKDTSKVENISVKLEDKKVRFDEVKGKKISDTEIKEAIKRAGKTYDVVKIRRQ